MENIVERKIWRMCFVCWITVATNTHSDYVIIINLPLQQYTNAPQCYVECTLPVLCLLFSNITPIDYFIVCSI